MQGSCYYYSCRLLDIIVLSLSFVRFLNCCKNSTAVDFVEKDSLIVNCLKDFDHHLTMTMAKRLSPLWASTRRRLLRREIFSSYYYYFADDTVMCSKENSKAI